MKRLVVTLLAACGPSVGVGDDDASTSEATTMSSETTATTPTTSTSATTATTQSTAASTTEMEDESTSGRGTSTSDDGDTFDSGKLLIENPDGGGTGIECDIWDQDCIRGKKCVPWANDGGGMWNASRCSPLDPAPSDIGEPCHVEDNPYSGIDDCGPASMCWDVDPVTLIGECVPFCAGGESHPTCGDGTSCWFDFEGVVLVCLPSCDPLTPACADGEVCAGMTFYQPGLPPSFACLPAAQFQPRAYGEECRYFDVCDVNLVCVRDNDVPSCAGDRCCTVIGPLENPPVCPDETQTCIPFDDAMDVDGLCYCGVES